MLHACERSIAILSFFSSFCFSGERVLCFHGPLLYEAKVPNSQFSERFVEGDDEKLDIYETLYFRILICV